MMKMRILPLLVIFLVCAPVFRIPAQQKGAAVTPESTQSTNAAVTPESTPGANSAATSESAPQPIPRQFRELALGMGLDDLKSALKKDGLFNFRGDRDVSFLPIREETLVETTGLSYIRRAFFQLSGGAVFIMAFSLDTRLMDHYSVFTSFVKKYGQPASLSPSEAVWETNDTRVSIERPLTVKYIDKTVFDRLRQESKTQGDWELQLRKEFLDDF